jgi:hypothetical protein
MYASMIYKVTPEHFGFTTRLKLLLAVGSLACFILPMFIFPLIRTSLAWNSREIISGLVTWLVLAIWWYVQHNYSLEVDDNSARIGGRVIRKGHVCYAREINSWPLRGGPRLVLSEHAPAWVRLFDGVIVIPKGLPEYEQVKKKVFTWIVNSADHVM